MKCTKKGTRKITGFDTHGGLSQYKGIVECEHTVKMTIRAQIHLFSSD